MWTLKDIYNKARKQTNLATKILKTKIDIYYTFYIQNIFWYNLNKTADFIYCVIDDTI